MPEFAANLSMMFQDIGFLDRFDAAARAGFKGVEFLFPVRSSARGDRRAARTQPADPGAVQHRARRLERRRARPRGVAGARAGIPRRRRQGDPLCQRDQVPAAAYDGRAVAGSGRDKAEGERVYIDNLRWAADRAAAAGLTCIIEPINTRDIPGYFLNYTGQAMRIIERVGRPNLQLQLDLYHVQIMEGDLATRMRALSGHYPHVQIAGNPGRHEPDIGEINYPYLFDLFDELGYSGWIGCEYRPEGRHARRARLGEEIRDRLTQVDRRRYRPPAAAARGRGA